jgi:hypothetical protein
MKMLASRRRPMRRPLRLPLLAAVLLGSAGCSAGLQGDTFHGEGFAFRIGALPPSWRRVDISHAALAFRDERDGGSVVLNGRCGVDGEDVPLDALTQHLFMRFTEREIVDQRVVPFDRREAMRTIVTAKLDGVPMKFETWVLKKDGCVYDVAYMAAPLRFDRGAEEFERFVRGFATVSAQGSPSSHGD